MHFGIVRFPGSNCDDDVLFAVNELLRPKGATGSFVWHKQPELGAVDAVILPGGFSYGDYLRAGAMAAHSPLVGAVKQFAERGGPVLAICNGFQVACEAGLLEGALAGNTGLRFECRDVHIRVEGSPTPFTRGLAGRVLKVPVAHREGRYVHDDPEGLAARGRVVFRYVDAEGETTEGANPNGSVSDIAGITNDRGNVVGLMPHPERACEALLGSGSEDGRLLFEAALDSAREASR